MGFRYSKKGPGLRMNRLLPMTFVILYRRCCRRPTLDIGALEGKVETPSHMTPIISSKGSPTREANVASSLVSTCTVNA
jgi:hypothetical protein